MIAAAASHRAWPLVFLLCIGAPRAATIDEDEARIEALIHAEQAAAKALVVDAQNAAAAEQALSSTPAPVVARAIAPSPDKITNDDWLVRSSMSDGQLKFDELSQHVGSKVDVVTFSDRVHRGFIAAADKRGLTLRVPRHGAGGDAVYTLRREQVARIDAR